MAMKKQFGVLGFNDMLVKKSKTEKAEMWKVIAPYVTTSKKFIETEDEQFSFYLEKKPEVLLKDLSTFMSDSVDLPSLFKETSLVLKNVTKAAWVTLYIVDTVNNEIYQGDFRVKDRHKVKWKIAENSIVAAYVAKKKQYVLIEDILLDFRFPDGIGYNATSMPKSVMCIPVVTISDDCFAVIELVRTIKQPAFEEADLKICVMVTTWMGVAIHQNQERLALQRQQELNDYLLNLIKCYFEDHVLMEKLMSEVIKFAKITLGAERGSFFIIDDDSEEMVAHLFDEDEENTGGGDTTSGPTKKVRFSKERGIAGLVARTGKTVNIKDAYTDSRFNKEIDQRTGFITRSILCMPILGATSVLGVVQVVNKKNGGCFTHADESLFRTFSLYCSLAMHYTNVHTQIKKQTHLTNLNGVTVKLQQVPCIHDSRFFNEHSMVQIPDDFDSWYVNDVDGMTYAPQYTLHMFTQLIDIKEMDLKKLMEFILVVRKFYRQLPYHNFEHAFNVCHCMYAILKRNIQKFSKLEVKALLVAALCHDIDHVGYTNNFLHLIKHDLAILYKTSTLENHHYQTTLRLLNQYDIFKGFSTGLHQVLHDEIRTIILATDLTSYFDTRADLEWQVYCRTFAWSNPTHRQSVKAIMMNSSDLSGNCKPFLVAKKITDDLYREFYKQGDLEKEIGVCPLSRMDRDKMHQIPDDQIRFQNVIVIPCVQTLRTVLPTTKKLYLGAIRLLGSWQDIVDTRNQKVWRQDDSIVNSCKILQIK